MTCLQSDNRTTDKLTQTLVRLMSSRDIDASISDADLQAEGFSQAELKANLPEARAQAAKILKKGFRA